MELLLRHRAVTFGLLAAFVSLASFLLLAGSPCTHTPEIAAVVRADRVALGLLLLGAHDLARA